MINTHMTIPEILFKLFLFIIIVFILKSLWKLSKFGTFLVKNKNYFCNVKWIQGWPTILLGWLLVLFGFINFFGIGEAEANLASGIIFSLIRFAGLLPGS